MMDLPPAPGTMISMPYKHNEARRHKIPKARYRVENWREYDVALRDRGSLTVWVTPEGDRGVASGEDWSSGAVSSLFGPRHRDRRDAAAGICPAMAADRGAVAFGDDVAGSEPRCSRPYDAVAPQRRVVLGHRPGRAGWSGHRGDRQHRLEGFRRRGMADGQAWRPRSADLAQVAPGHRSGHRRGSRFGLDHDRGGRRLAGSPAA